MWQAHGKMIPYIVFMLVFLLFHLHTTSAQSLAQTSICTYQETRQNVPINPKTNKPYTPEERNQEPFAGASISKEQIKQCLRAQKPIQNHHIVFEDYRDAWQELAREMEKYDIPLLIKGGVLHAKPPYDERTQVGGVDFGGFHDQTTTYTSQLTEEERKTASITAPATPFCYCTAQKHLTVKMSIISMVYAMVSLLPLQVYSRS
jgi:hypothetical protein